MFYIRLPDKKIEVHGIYDHGIISKKLYETLVKLIGK